MNSRWNRMKESTQSHHQNSDFTVNYNHNDQTVFSMASLFSYRSCCTCTIFAYLNCVRVSFSPVMTLDSKNHRLTGFGYRLGDDCPANRMDAGNWNYRCISNRICRTTKDYIQSVLRGSLMQSYYHRLLTKDYAFLSTLGTGTIQSKMDKGIDAEISMYTDILVAILSVGVRTSMLSVVFFRTMPWINGVFVILGFVVLMTHRLLLPRIKIMQDRLSAITEQTTAQTTKIAMEHHTIRLHNQQSYELGLLQNIWAPHPSLAWKADLVNEIAFLVMEMGFRSLNALGYFILGAAVLSADLTLGTMTMIIMYMDRMRRPISTLMQQMSNRRKNIVRRDRMHAMLDEKNIITDWDERLCLPIGDLVFDHVTFGYSVYDIQKYTDETNNDTWKTITQPSQPKHFLTPLFSDFSLTIPQGKMTALVGRSGSGKTTLVKLLLRLYDIQAWSIMIGSQDIRSLVRAERYDQIGYLSQEPGIFDGTVRENLMYWVQPSPTPPITGGTVISQSFSSQMGKEKISIACPPRCGEGGPSGGWGQPLSNTSSDLQKNADDTHLREALELACIADRVRQFGSWLDEQLGEKGIKLSGWEKQRLAIARLFLRNPSVIILDEPSAALDSESAYLITQSFGGLFANKTVIVIAHRLQTVMHADHIVVMEQGKIVEMGKHQDLVAQWWVYAWLVDLQHGRIGE